MERKLKPNVEDTRRIDIEDEYAVDYWTQAFNVTQTKLRSAVQAVGNSADDVKRELKK